jgi:hypothetical protein
VAITGGSITGITDLAVADGGTGASTLTGYVKGNGTTPLTASATIPNTDITGLGTMSTQDANAVAITGGSINGTAIGATTTSTIAGTTGTFSGNLTVDTNTLFVNATNNCVGVGTSSPTAQLHVEGSTTAIATITTASITNTTLNVVTVVANTIAVGDRVYGVGVAPITKIVSQIDGTTGGAGNYVVSVNQTVGSGTMYTSSGAAATVRITDTDTTVLAGQPSGTIEFFVSDINTPTPGVGAYISAVSEDASPDTALTFGTRLSTGGGVDANERMRIDSAGNVGINKINPTAKLDVTGSIASSGSILSSGTGGIGYATGAGAAVTQLTSRTTQVPSTGASPTGAITLFTAAPVVGTYFSFTVPNTGIAVTDTVVLSVRGGSNTYVANCSQIIAATSFMVTMVSVAGIASDAPIVNFAIIKGVSA